MEAIWDKANDNFLATDGLLAREILIITQTRFYVAQIKPKKDNNKK